MELDSKQLFIKATFLFRQVAWLYDWQYIGLAPGLDTRLAKLLSIRFDSEKVILIRGRHDSAILSQSDIQSLASQGLCHTDFTIWNLDFVEVLAFNKIGVYREGVSS